MKTPLFFKLWFVFVGLLAAGIIGTVIYVAVAVVSAGPEGIGAEIGRAVKAFNEASQP